jgi:hypothetical protein
LTRMGLVISITRINNRVIGGPNGFAHSHSLDLRRRPENGGRRWRGVPAHTRSAYQGRLSWATLIARVFHSRSIRPITCYLNRELTGRKHRFLGRLTPRALVSIILPTPHTRRRTPPWQLTDCKLTGSLPT